VYLGNQAHPQVVFDYTPNRRRDGPMTFLNVTVRRTTGGGDDSVGVQLLWRQ
jgi:hypothetical protein